MTNRKLIYLTCILYSLPAIAAEKTIYAFNWFPPPSQLQTGAYPSGTLLRDASGALYGTNLLGGEYYNGTVFKLSPPGIGQTDWTVSVLHTFSGVDDGGMPNPNLVMDASGALYGTTEGGGSWMDQGLVYKLTPPDPGSTQWKYSVIHYFNFSYFDGPGDGTNPSGGLIMDKNGNLYGTTDCGGDPSDPDGIGSGTVFKLAPLDAARTKWQETILYRFRGGVDGANPMSQLTLDGAGNLYSTTMYGGTGKCSDLFDYVLGCGTVFKLSPPALGQTAWTKTTLHHFGGGNDGAIPQAKVTIGNNGSVYGTAFEGGSGGCTDGLLNPIGCGIVFELKPPGAGAKDWTETILYTFTGPDGAFPQGGVIVDASGALIGTASKGGPVDYYGMGGYGLIYKLTPPGFGQTRWAFTDLYDFNISVSGTEAVGELIRDPQGHYFGVTNGGGPNLGGAVYEFIP